MKSRRHEMTIVIRTDIACHKVDAVSAVKRSLHNLRFQSSFNLAYPEDRQSLDFYIANVKERPLHYRRI